MRPQRPDAELKQTLANRLRIDPVHQRRSLLPRVDVVDFYLQRDYVYSRSLGKGTNARLNSVSD